MSGAVAARALHERFDEIWRAEWVRLGRKVASLEARQRSEVEAIIAEVVGALAASSARRLVETNEPALCAAVLRLFGVVTDRAHLSAR
jgi:hypothetical protein